MGKQLIQVVDDGSGMSVTDARMSFERHATSKIRSADDLFHIRTMGFRGEALASIASVAQVELRTRRQEDTLGTRIVIEGSTIKTQEDCATTPGTNMAVRNLFTMCPQDANSSNRIRSKCGISWKNSSAQPSPALKFTFPSTTTIRKSTTCLQQTSDNV